jgi:hypothetical protein
LEIPPSQQLRLLWDADLELPHHLSLRLSFQESLER